MVNGQRGPWGRVSSEYNQFSYPTSANGIHVVVLLKLPPKYSKTSGLEGKQFKCFVIYLDFPLDNHIAKFNVRATTAQLYPGRKHLNLIRGT